MASRSAKRPKGRAAVQDLVDDGEGVGAFLSRHRVVVGGATAFLVAFSYVAANAIWYQPHRHGGAFFPTRPSIAGDQAAVNPELPSEGINPETIIRLEREGALETTEPQETASQPVGDPTVQEVQRILAELNLYSGKVDGLSGPQTRTAIENYQKTVGLDVTGTIDEKLMQQLGAASSAAVPAPPVPRPTAAGTDQIETASAGPSGDPMVMRIQAGLKAFGNEGIEIDGVVGSRTKSAIHEFQSLFGLPETGEPDEALYAKMREIGLTN